MKIQDIDKYIIEEVYKGKCGDWVDYDKGYKQSTRRVKYRPIEMFGRKYRMIRQSMEFDYLEPEQKKKNDEKRLEREKLKGLNIWNNFFIEKYFEYAEIEYQNTGETKIIDNSEIKKEKDRIIDYFNNQIKEIVIEEFKNKNIEINCIATAEKGTAMNIKFFYREETYILRFDYHYFDIRDKTGTPRGFSKYKRLELGLRNTDSIPLFEETKEIDPDKFRELVSLNLDLFKQYVNR